MSALNHDKIHSQNLLMWYDPAAGWTSSAAPPSSFVGFEGRSAVQPGTYQARVFPQYIDSLRADGLRNWDAKVMRRAGEHTGKPSMPHHGFRFSARAPSRQRPERQFVRRNCPDSLFRRAET
jgi:hypothetical protein